MRRLRRWVAAAFESDRPNIPLGCSTPLNLHESPTATARVLLATPEVAADFAIGINPDAPAEVIAEMERLSHG